MDNKSDKAYKVLIVEDDPMVAMINEQYVTKNPDFTVVATCRNGKDAIEFLSSNKVDLVVLDVFMPYMDGVETLKKIRENKFQTEVIMVTAANDTSTLEQTMNLGVVDYLIKPFAMERFQVALEKFSIKASTLNKNKSGLLDQNCIDSIICGGGSGALTSGGDLSENHNEEELLPKGIQLKTLKLIKKYFEENPQWQSGDTVAHKLGLSIVTVRHYLNYLVEKGELAESVNYETGGRPSMLYKL